MAKFNTYGFRAVDEQGATLKEGKLQALSYQSAWHKAVEESFDAIEPGTGSHPEELFVYRINSPTEFHG